MTANHPRTCENETCGRVIYGRLDKLYCGETCRQAAHRESARLRLARVEEQRNRSLAIVMGGVLGDGVPDTIRFRVALAQLAWSGTKRHSRDVKKL